MSELKPCPFCGSEATDEANYCACCNPDCEFVGWFFLKEQWNTRPVEDALRAENEELKAKVAQLEEYHKGAIHALNSRGEEYIGRLQTDNASLKAKVAELEAECRNSRTAKQDLETLKDCYKDKEADNQRMREAIDYAMGVIEKLCLPENHIEDEHYGEYQVIAEAHFKLKDALQGGE